MKEAILIQHRRFQIWSYTTSHGQLLLRSPKSADHLSRFDILFKDVAHICIPTVFNDLTVLELDRTSELPFTTGYLSLNNRMIYKLSGDNYSGYIIAGTFFWNEDQGEYDEPSPLLI